MNREPIFGIGDKVRIVKYGHPIWESKNTNEPKLSYPVIAEDENLRYLDMSPGLVGQEGLVDKVTITQGIPQYAIDGIKDKHAWYNEEQMEMINRNPNR